MMASRRPLALLVVFALVFAALGVEPRYRQDWALENLLVAVLVPWLVLNHRRLRFSDGSYTMIFAFLVLHEIGAHYTYSEVPYDDWSARLLGWPIGEMLGWQRNHYDRCIHFAYGFLMLQPATELLRRVAPARGGWARVLPVLFLLSHSALYELVEWAAALAFGGDLGVAYLGTQGDEWDAQKDMALAFSGATLMTLFVGVRAASRQRRSAIPVAVKRRR